MAQLSHNLAHASADGVFNGLTSAFESGGLSGWLLAMARCVTGVAMPAWFSNPAFFAQSMGFDTELKLVGWTIRANQAETWACHHSPFVEWGNRCSTLCDANTVDCGRLGDD
jgi:hypothetical protein